jgi:hypothetical protein
MHHNIVTIKKAMKWGKVLNVYISHIRQCWKHHFESKLKMSLLLTFTRKIVIFYGNTVCDILNSLLEQSLRLYAVIKIMASPLLEHTDF